MAGQSIEDKDKRKKKWSKFETQRIPLTRFHDSDKSYDWRSDIESFVCRAAAIDVIVFHFCCHCLWLLLLLNALRSLFLFGRYRHTIFVPDRDRRILLLLIKSQCQETCSLWMLCDIGLISTFVLSPFHTTYFYWNRLRSDTIGPSPIEMCLVAIKKKFITIYLFYWTEM